MADFNSKYTGEQVDALLDIVSQGGVGGGGEGEVQKTTEAEITAMGFTKNLGTITEVKMNGVTKGTSGVVDLGTVITSHQDISGKADKSSLATVATSGSYNDLSNKPTIPSAVTESTVSGWGFTKNTGTYSKPSGGIPKSDLAIAVQTSLGKADSAIQYTSFDQLDYLVTANGFESKQGGTTYALPDMSNGDEDDIIATTNTLKTINGQSIVGSGDITISGGGGGTITGVSANGTSIATSGVANIPAASTSAYGVTKLSSATNSTSTTLAATASAVKSAYDLANSYKGTVTGVKINGTTKSPTSGTVDLGTVITSHQDISGKQDKLTSGTNIKTINNTSLLGSGNIAVQPTLVSGTNIKTINGTSILGSGNITISGGGGSSSGSGAYAEVNHGTSDTTFTLTPNTFHVWDEVGALTLTLGSETAGVANEYLFQFTSGATATSLTLPDGVKWVNDSVPTISENKIYQISVLNNLAVALEFSNEVQLPVNKATWIEGDFKNGGTLTFQYPVASDLTIVFEYTMGPYTISAGQTSIYVSWGEPMPPVPISISPTSDTTYRYEL